MPRRKTEVKWFARGGNLAKMGPFDSQLAATNALRITKESAARMGTPNAIFHPDAFVWPEEVKAG